MASTITHIAIAKKIQEKIEIENTYDYYLGCIAPDLSKQVGQSKEESHFLINSQNDIPNINIFVKRYPTFKYKSFDLGYFIHIYTDKLWKEEFLPNIIQNDTIKLLDGSTIKASKEEMFHMIYSDYTNLNKQLIEEYQLDLSLFHEDFKVPNTHIKEIPVDKLDLLINKMNIIFENSKIEKPYTFNFPIIKDFIEKASEKILSEIEKY